MSASIPFGLGKRSVTVKILNNPPVQNTFIRMRVVSDYSAIPNACATLSYGQSEDYSLYIDSKKPTVTLSLPKPKVYGVFNASIKFSEYVGDLDTTKVVMTNARIIGYTKMNPLQYTLSIKPIKPGKVYAKIAANTFKDLAGNFNLAVADSTLFEFGLNSFTFPGYSKTDTIIHSASGGNIKSYVFAGTGLDSLVAAFNITDSATLFINSTKQVSGSTKNNFKNTVSYVLKSLDGSITKQYDVKVIVLKDTICRLDSFVFINPKMKGIISEVNRTVAITLPFGTYIKANTCNIYFPLRSTIKVNGTFHINNNSTYDFSSSVKIKVYAEDTSISKVYTVMVNVLKNTASDLLQWSVKTPASIGLITPSSTGGIIIATLPFRTSLKTLIANFKISDSAQLEVKNLVQNSGVTAQDYSDTVLLKVISQDQAHFKLYKVKLSIQPNIQCNIIAYDFIIPAKSVVIIQDTALGKVTLSVPENTDLSSLTAVFTVSDSAKIFLSGVSQVTGVTKNDFTNTLRYKVIAQDQIHFKEYDVVVNKLLGVYDTKRNIMSIYPNPGLGLFYIDWLVAQTKHKITITDLSGKVLLQQENKNEIDLNNFSSGFYYVNIDVCGFKQVFKIVKI